MTQFIKSICYLITGAISVAAQAQEVEMADTMRAEGKIYVVVAIILVIVTGMLVFLFVLDRKITKLEQQFSEKKNT